MIILSSPQSLSRPGLLALALMCLQALSAASAWAAAASVTVQTGNTAVAYTPTTGLKTVNFSTATLANTSGISAGAKTGSGAFTTSASSVPSNFSGTYAVLNSGTSSNAGTTVPIQFANGANYVSLLWFVDSDDSTNVLTVNYSDGSTASKSVANCSSSTSASCVGYYDDNGIVASVFSLINNLLCGFLGNCPPPPSAIRIVAYPATGAKITSITLTAKPTVGFLSKSNNVMRVDEITFADEAVTPPPVSGGLHHVEILAPSSYGMTCQSTAFRVRACADASCATPYTAGVTGTLTFGGTSLGSYTIASGQSSASVTAATTTAKSALMAATSSPAQTATGYCGLGSPVSNATGACTFTARTSGIVASLPNHKAGNTNTLSVKLLKDVGGVCKEQATSGSLNLKFTASVTGGLGNLTGLLIGGNSLLGGVLGALPLGISNTGTMTPSFKYDNVGIVKVKVEVASVGSGVTGLLSGLLGSLVGQVTDVVAYVVPDRFDVLPAVTKVGAGNDLSLQILARNANGVTTTNFDSTAEASLRNALTLTNTVTSAATRKSGPVNNPPLTVGDVSFVNGVASVKVNWDEVGTVDITSLLNDYLGSGQAVTGKVTGVKFVPAKFDVQPAVQCGAFQYAGQPLPVTVTAKNAKGNTTLNYDGSQSGGAANAVAVTAGSGSAAMGSLAAGNFGDGAAAGTITYALADKDKQTAPLTNVPVKATDTDAVTGASASGVTFRSGRIKLSNAFGSERGDLQIPIQVQYWSGKSWVPASDDSCTTSASLPLSAVARVNYRNHQGQVTSSWSTTPASITMNGGKGVLTLRAPGANKTGTVDVALDLSSTGANQPWLRSLNVACGNEVACNPTARATFGIYTPETKKTVNIQNVN